VSGGSVSEEVLDPSLLGVAPAPAEALRGGDAAYNASVARSFLGGEPGPVRDAVLLNAAAAIAASDGGGTGVALVERLRYGLGRAAEAVDSGAAAAALERWVAVSRSLAPEA
jgi:anthranilate phosphoribosyltransferase